jgi:hypothetical protein
MDKARAGDQRRDQPIDGAEADQAFAARAAQQHIEFVIGEGLAVGLQPSGLTRGGRAGHAAVRAAAYAHGISSSRHEAGHRLTSLVRTPAR